MVMLFIYGLYMKFVSVRGSPQAFAFEFSEDRSAFKSFQDS